MINDFSVRSLEIITRTIQTRSDSVNSLRCILNLCSTYVDHNSYKSSITVLMKLHTTGKEGNQSFVLTIILEEPKQK